MKPNYKNWVPKGMVAGILLAVFRLTDVLSGSGQLAAQVIFGILFALLLIVTIICVNWYHTFSYDGKKQFPRRIIDKVSDYVVLPEHGTGLDVGCGSGALTIACAKKNLNASMVGLDR